MSPLLILSILAGGALLLTRKPKAKVPSKAKDDPGEPGKRDPTTKLPSTQLPKPKPKPKPPKPTPDPDPGVVWGDPELIDWGTLYLYVQESNEAKWRYGYEPVPFVKPFYAVKTYMFGADGFKSKSDALWHAANFGRKKIEYEILKNITAPTGKQVTYYDHGYGVTMDHVADPLSLTGVTIEWSVFSQDVSPDDSPFASGASQTEPQALQEVEEVMVSG